MEILFIAPLPPPVHGQSLASEVLLKSLMKKHNIAIVNTNKTIQKSSVLSFKRFFKVFLIYFQILKKIRGSDTVYLHISESLGGNIKDLIIYSIIFCFNRLHFTYIHLHGGSIKIQLFDRYNFLKHINKFFISKLAGVIVLGESHVEIFSTLIKKEKIYIVPNFSEDYLFVDDATIKAKFLNINTIKIIFMSNLIPGKGYKQLLDAYKSLHSNLQKIFQLDFCGSFNSVFEQSEFTKGIKELQQVNYHGIVGGQKKKEIMNNAHVFCLPTSYYEGQPISILEAYASGCYVITTNMGGIKDIFGGISNGYELKDNSIESIQTALDYIRNHSNEMFDTAVENNKTARSKYRTEMYCNNISDIINLRNKQS